MWNVLGLSELILQSWSRGICFLKERQRYYVNNLQLNIEKEGSSLVLAFCPQAEFSRETVRAKSETFRRWFIRNIIR